jgi:hypothetical protein
VLVALNVPPLIIAPDALGNMILQGLDYLISVDVVRDVVVLVNPVV